MGSAQEGEEVGDNVQAGKPWSILFHPVEFDGPEAKVLRGKCRLRAVATCHE